MERESARDHWDAARLERSFFARPPEDVAYDLVGSMMRVRDQDGERIVQILETEAYGGADDAASHAFAGPTPRCQVMFGPAGHLYVYRIYGMHWCMNVVTGADDAPSAVLLRAATLCREVASDAQSPTPITSLSGPGNLTRALRVTGEDNGVDCCAEPFTRIGFYRGSALSEAREVAASSRVGITRDVARQWRFFARGHRDVSRPTKGRRG